MSVKDDFDRIVGMERAKLESAARRHAEFPERQQQRFRPLQLLLEELGASVDGRFLRIRMEDSGATVEVGKPKPDASFFATDMQWQLRPNYSLHFSASARDYLFNEEPGFRVAETRCPRFPADDAFTTILLFETETQVIEHLVQMVAKRIAEYLCTAQDRS
jgi:hypothetical protein